MLAIACAAAYPASAAAQTERRDKVHLESSLGAEWWRLNLLVDRPEELGGGRELARRSLFPLGFELCPLAVVNRYLDLGGCLAIFIIPGGEPDPALDPMIYDQSPWTLSRLGLRSTVRPIKYLRTGVDVSYRALIVDGSRASGLDLRLRLGADIGPPSKSPVFIELTFGAQAAATRTDELYFSYPIPVEGRSVSTPSRMRSTWSLGLHVGGTWRLPHR